jgi:hypothetical protein
MVKCNMGDLTLHPDPASSASYLMKKGLHLEVVCYLVLGKELLN